MRCFVDGSVYSAGLRVLRRPRQAGRARVNARIISLHSSSAVFRRGVCDAPASKSVGLDSKYYTKLRTTHNLLTNNIHTRYVNRYHVHIYQVFRYPSYIIE